MRSVPITRVQAALLLGLGCGPWFSGPAAAQMESREAISLQNQILELRHEIEQGGGGGNAQPVAPPIGSGQAAPSLDQSGLAPQLLDRVQTLEQQVRDMRGELDQLTNQVQTQNAALSKQISDMNFAMQQNGGGAAPGAAAASGGDGPLPPAAATPAAPAAPPPHRTPEATLAAGNAALGRHDYAAAQSAAQEVLSGPRSPRQVDAQFLLGQSLAGQRQYQQSAVAYYDAYNRAPRSGRAPEALLGVSASMLALGDKPSACQALAKMHAEFPQPAPRAKAAYASLRGRAGCH
jgi:TolA-binding protein